MPGRPAACSQRKVTSVKGSWGNTVAPRHSLPAAGTAVIVAAGGWRAKSYIWVCMGLRLPWPRRRHHHCSLVLGLVGCQAKVRPSTLFARALRAMCMDPALSVADLLGLAGQLTWYAERTAPGGLQPGSRCK